MDRPLLSAGRRRIEALASPTGEYIVVCARTGSRPVPVAGKRFPDRRSATAAAAVETLYRAQLRRYDDRAAVHDLVVTQDAPSQISSTRDRAGSRASGQTGETA